MEYSRHAGGCCGISVVHGFDDATEADLDGILRRHDTMNEHGAGAGRLLEAVLSERQVNPDFGRNATMIVESIRNRGFWAPILFSKGFRLVARFRNSNSDQICYVFHRHPEFMDHVGGLPFPSTPADISRALAAGRLVVPTAATSTLTREMFGRHLTVEDIPNIPVGTRLRYVFAGQEGASDNYHNRVYTFVGSRNRRSIAVTEVDGGGRDAFNINRFQIVEDQMPEAPPVVPPVVEDPVPTVVTRLYVARLEATPHLERAFFSLEDLRAVYPRARNVCRRDVYSDGQIHEVRI